MAERKAFLIRISRKLHEELKAWAHQEMRSINGQIEWILREAVRKHRGKAPDDDEEAGGEETE